jgi:hypothetical protein
MPYLNGFTNEHGLAANYFANVHSSTPKYFELTTGHTRAPLVLTDTVTPHTFPLDANNVVNDPLAAARTWKSYAEALRALG